MIYQHVIHIQNGQNKGNNMSNAITKQLKNCATI